MLEEHGVPCYSGNTTPATTTDGTRFNKYPVALKHQAPDQSRGQDKALAWWGAPAFKAEAGKSHMNKL